MSFQAWNPDFFPLPGNATFDHTLEHVTVIARTPNNLDLFVIGNDNHVWSTYWSAAGGWCGNWFPLPGVAAFDRATQRIAAVARTANNIDLFVIGFENHIWTTAWSAAHGWNGDFAPLPGKAVFDHTKQHVAAVARTPDNLDVFVIGFEDHVWSSFWTAQHGWNPDFFPLPGRIVFDHNVQQVAAVTRRPDVIDLFVVGNDGRVWSSAWTGPHGWAPDFFLLPGGATFDHLHQTVTAITRGNDNLDLFIIGNDNRVWSSYWTPAGWAPNFFPLPGAPRFEHLTQKVAATCRDHNIIDLFVVGMDNHVYSSAWLGPQGWSPDFFPIPGASWFDHGVQQVVAVSRAYNNLDLFSIGSENHCWTTYWAGRNPITLNATAVPQQSPHLVVPFDVIVTIPATDGICTQTSWSVTEDGKPVPGYGETFPNGASILRKMIISKPGTYLFTFTRTGLTGPGPATTIMERGGFIALAAAPPPPPAAIAPTLKVEFGGTLANVDYKITGTGFTPNKPGPAAAQYGIQIRVVDESNPANFRLFFGVSNAAGALEEYHITGSLVALTPNSLGKGTIDISATDGRANPHDATGLLWSNVEKHTY